MLKIGDPVVLTHSVRGILAGRPGRVVGVNTHSLEVAFEGPTFDSEHTQRRSIHKDHLALRLPMLAPPLFDLEEILCGGL